MDGSGNQIPIKHLSFQPIYITKTMSKSLGRHILVEFFGCTPDILNDVITIEKSIVDSDIARQYCLSCEKSISMEIQDQKQKPIWKKYSKSILFPFNWLIELKSIVEMFNSFFLVFLGAALRYSGSGD
jgi:hypothetical protein